MKKLSEIKLLFHHEDKYLDANIVSTDIKNRYVIVESNNNQYKLNINLIGTSLKCNDEDEELFKFYIKIIFMLKNEIRNDIPFMFNFNNNLYNVCKELTLRERNNVLMNSISFLAKNIYISYMNKCELILSRVDYLKPKDTLILERRKTIFEIRSKYEISELLVDNNLSTNLYLYIGNTHKINNNYEINKNIYKNIYDECVIPINA